MTSKPSRRESEKKIERKSPCPAIKAPAAKTRRHKRKNSPASCRSLALDDTVSKIAPDDTVSKIAPDDNVRKIAPDDNVSKIAPDDKVSKIKELIGKARDLTKLLRTTPEQLGIDVPAGDREARQIGILRSQTESLYESFDIFEEEQAKLFKSYVEGYTDGKVVKVPEPVINEVAYVLLSYSCLHIQRKRVLMYLLS